MSPRLPHRSAAQHGFSLDVRPEHGALRLELRGELDVLTTRQVRERVSELVGAGFGEIVLDLRGLWFIDSTGMRLLVGLHHAAKRDGWRLLLVRGPESVHRVFEIAGTSRVLPFTWRTPSE
jgi:anti-sigma B factor antagonist